MPAAHPSAAAGLQEAPHSSFLLVDGQILLAEQLPGSFKGVQPIIRGGTL